MDAGSINVRYVCTNEQLADILTKPLSRPKFQEMRDKIGVQAMKKSNQVKEVNVGTNLVAAVLE